MINLYRIIAYPNESFVFFQGDDDDYQQIKRILPLNELRESNKYETGYYVSPYLRGADRAKNEKKVRQYLSSHYQPIPLELSVFKSSSSLPATRSLKEWATCIARQYAEFFRSRDRYIVNDTANREYKEYKVLRRPKQAITLPPELEIFEGVTYRVQVSNDYHIIISCDIAYEYHLDGKPVDWETIAQKYGTQDQLLKKLDNFSKRDTNDLFKLFDQFIRSLPTVSDKEVHIEPIPLKSTDLGLKTWFWEHDYPISLVVGDDQKVPLAQWITDYEKGFYKPLSNPLKVVYLFPDAGITQWCPTYNQELLDNLIRETLRNLLQAEPSLYSFEYATDGIDVDRIVTNCKNTVEYNQGDNVLIVMIGPPEEARNAEDSKLQILEKFTYDLSKQVRQLWRGSYLVSLDWTKLQKQYDRKYIVENAILKGLWILGVQPWILANFPLLEQLPPSQVCIIGIDAKPDKWDKGGAGRLGGVVFDGTGILRGFHLVRIQDNEFATSETFYQLVKALLNYFEKIVGEFPKYLLIHRDGYFGSDEAEVVLEKSNKLGMTCDLVEIIKHGVPRLRQGQNRGGTASKDIAVGDEESGIVWMVNTMAFQENDVFPAPQAIQIRHVEGTTPLKTIAAQVYAMTRMHCGSFRCPVSQPATTAYAHALVNNASLRPNQTQFGKVIGEKSVPYWL